ncbi:MAG: hypothetical protein C0483_13390 [Pirellula sp.]|nr:hypothetical protein [Pirellula sp.]
MYPFDYPTQTVFYLVLYGATLVLHVLPMNYVLAGSTYLAFLGVWEALRGPALAQRPIVEVLRDWMPFALGVTITAAVAPLLFLQILYQRPFYTANLLLFHRWMAILPVLIAAFYLLYLQKSKRWHHFSAWVRAVVSVGILCCFAFVAWSFTENHLLSTRGQEVWTEVYGSNRWFYRDPELMPRLTVWYVGAFPVLAAALIAQFWSTGFVRRDENAAPDPVTDPAIRTLAVLALGGLVASVFAGGGYFVFLEEPIRQRLTARDVWPYLAGATLGIIVQAVIWRRVWQRAWIDGRTLTFLCLAVVGAVGSATALREARRTSTIDLNQYASMHVTASIVGGLGTFLLFLFVCTGALIAVVVAVRRGLIAGSQPPIE